MMFVTFIIYLFIGILLNSSESSKSLHRFPCVLSDTKGYCVPKRECCSVKSWVYTHLDYGDCPFKQFCCTEKVFCQNCPNGTRDRNDTCIDINECEETYGLCSGHGCHNLNGSFTCNCLPGYRLTDESKTCEATNGSQTYDLLFSATLTINSLKMNEKRRLDLTINQKLLDKNPIEMLYSGTVTPHSLDYSYSGNYMAWIDISLDQINMAPIDDNQPSLVTERLFPRFARKPNSLAIDWIHDLIYWTDLGTRTINVVNVKKPFDHFIVVNGTNQEPHDIVVNLLTNTLVWTNVGLKPKILRSFQDGSNQSVLYSKSKQVFCLTIDIFIKRYYFLDLEFSLFSIDFDGGDERKILHSRNLLIGVNSMSIYFDDIYVSTNSLIYKFNKFGLFDRRLGERAEAMVSSFATNLNNESFLFQDLIHSKRQQLFNVKIVNSVLQPKVKNRCQFAKCSHVCLPSDSKTGFRCLCPQNMVSVDNRVCAEKKFENLVLESLFWEQDLQKLIEHSIVKSVTLRQLLNQSFGQQIDLKKLFAESFEQSMKIRELFNLTTKERNEMKTTFIQSINETLFWKQLLNITFNNKYIFEKLLNQSFYSKNFTEIIEFLNQMIDSETQTEIGEQNKSRIGAIIILVFVLIGIITIIGLFVYIGYKLRLFSRANTEEPIYKRQNYQNPTYHRAYGDKDVETNA